MPFCACFGGQAPREEAYAVPAHKPAVQSAKAASDPSYEQQAASIKADPGKEAAVRNSVVPLPLTASPAQAVPVAKGSQNTGVVDAGVLQGLELQKRISRLTGHWWSRVEDAVDILARAYGAACVSIWLMDEQTESFVVLISKGPMRQAVQPGYSLHLGSEYDANSPSSLSSLWETKAAQTFSVCRSSHSSSSHGGRRFPADWKLLYNAHHFTDFIAWPLLSCGGPRGGGVSGLGPALQTGGAQADLLSSGVGARIITNSLGASSNAANAAIAAAAAAAASSVDAGPYVVGAVTLYLSRPGADPVSDPLPSVFTSGIEQELVGLAMSQVLLAGGMEPVRQLCELVVSLQSASGTGEVAAAVAACLSARLRHVLSVQPAALLALVPPRQVSAIVFRDMTAAGDGAGGNAGDSLVGHSSSQTLPLLHPALASAGAGANVYSGSHSLGGISGSAATAAARAALRNAGLHVGAPHGGGGDGTSPAATIERSPSLLGTGLRHGEAGAGSAATGPLPQAVGMGAATDGAITGIGHGSRFHMQNSRSMGVLQQNNPSGLFSCRLDRMPSRYKALVFPLSHTLLQTVLQQRMERRIRDAQQARANFNVGGSGGAAEPNPDKATGGKTGSHTAPAATLKDMCMTAAAAAAAAGGATTGGWIISDCNEHLHAVHSPSRDVYVMTRVNGRRPHSLVLATAELNCTSGACSGEGSAGHSAAGGACVSVYLAFPERLPQALLEAALNDTMLIMRRLVAPLVQLRFDSNLAEEWTALAAGANNLPSPGGPVLRIQGASVSASQMRHTQGLPSMLISGAGNATEGTSSPNMVALGATETVAHSNNCLSKLGPAGAAAAAAAAGNGSPVVGAAPHSLSTFGGMVVGPGGAPATGQGTASELHLEGLSAGEALQQMSVLVSSYMDTLQALQGQLMASDRVAEALRREDLPHLQLLEVLGHGGGGVVFRGKLHALEVAVKVFEVPGDLATAAGLASLSNAGLGGKDGGGPDGKANQAAWPAIGDRRVLQRSALELAVTASVSHPHIVQVYSLYTNMVLVKQKPPKHGTSGVQLLELSTATAMSRMEEGIPCSALCIEYCDMGTLAHAIDQNRFMTVTPLGARRPALKAICTTLLEVALALRHLHARSLAHCDLKPANVLLKSSRRDSRGFTCKLADFGYVSVLKASVPGGRPTILPEEACGTVTHMAPETFIKGQPLDASVDTYSFGVLMWELFTCSRPYADVPEDQIAQRVTLKGLRPIFPSDTPRAYSALARQCWSQDPNERPSASEIVSAIENMLQIMSTQLPAIPPLKPKTAAAAGPPAAGAAAAAPTASPGKVDVVRVDNVPSALSPGGSAKPGAPAAGAGPRAA